MKKEGHLIFLKGTSSSGKTTIAKALQEKLRESFMFVSIDQNLHLYPDWFLNPTPELGRRFWHNLLLLFYLVSIGPLKRLRKR